MNEHHYLVHEGSGLPALPVSESMCRPEALAAPEEMPDARIFLTDDAGQGIAYAALWWTEAPPLESEKIGTIGGFDAIDEDAAKPVKFPPTLAAGSNRFQRSTAIRHTRGTNPRFPA